MRVNNKTNRMRIKKVVHKQFYFTPTASLKSDGEHEKHESPVIAPEPLSLQSRCQAFNVAVALVMHNSDRSFTVTPRGTNNEIHEIITA